MQPFDPTSPITPPLSLSPVFALPPRKRNDILPRILFLPLPRFKALKHRALLALRQLGERDARIQEPAVTVEQGHGDRPGDSDGEVEAETQGGAEGVIGGYDAGAGVVEVGEVVAEGTGSGGGCHGGSRGGGVVCGLWRVREVGRGCVEGTEW